MKILVIVLLFLLTGCTSKEETLKDVFIEKMEEKNETQLVNDFVNQKMKEMSLEEKIAQMTMIYHYATTYEDVKEEIVTYQPGGFILFSENAKSFSQLSSFITDMQEDSKIPMFISVDQEGGRVQRLSSNLGFTVIPPMRNIGKKKDKKIAFEVGRVIGSELNTLGINMDFAPEADISSNPSNTIIANRAFGSDAVTVSEMSVEVARGLEEENIIPVYKHFPGHGDTLADSHYDLPVLNKTREELEQLELIPFQNAIQNGAKVIMVGHIAVPKISGNIPASLSKEIITNILREEYQFDGVVITDAINMGAIVNNYTEKETILMALKAGVDILLMPSNVSNVIQYVKEAIADEKLSEERIDDSVRRILTLKYNWNLFTGNPKNDPSILGSLSHRMIIDQTY